MTICNPLLGRRRKIRLAMIDAIRSANRGYGLGTADAHLDRVDAAISLRRCKRQAIFVADKLRNLSVRGLEFLFGCGEVGAATCGFSHALQ